VSRTGAIRETADRGGRRIQTGRIFCSDRLHPVSVADVALLHDEFGVCSLVDLRGEDQVAGEGRGLLAEPGPST
jgi:hypothetical protein